MKMVKSIRKTTKEEKKPITNMKEVEMRTIPMIENLEPEEEEDKSREDMESLTGEKKVMNSTQKPMKELKDKMKPKKKAKKERKE